MKILLDGYFDHNLGDDLMLTLAADGLKEHELYVPSKKIKLDNAEYTTAKNGFDAYLKVTGSGFQIYNTLGIAYRLKDMHRESRCAPVKAVIGCNIASFINRTAENVIKLQLSMYGYITTRDSFSYSYIRQNLPRLDVSVYPDIVFSLPDSMIPDIQCENALGISVNNIADSAKLADIADRYIEETGSRVLLLCFDTGIENDERAARKLLSNSKYKDKLEIVLYENIPDMLSHMKRCAFIYGARFHSIVLAARMGIPFMPVVSSAKIAHMLADIGYMGDREFVLPDGTVTAAGRHVAEFNEYLKRQG